MDTKFSLLDCGYAGKEADSRLLRTAISIQAC